MKNKILVEIVIPIMDETYDLFIPANKRIGNVVLLINKAIEELSNGLYKCNINFALYNSASGIKYDSNQIVRKTDIRNGTKLILN